MGKFGFLNILSKILEKHDFVTSKVTSLRHVGQITFFDTAPVSHVNRLRRKRARAQAQVANLTAWTQYY